LALSYLAQGIGAVDGACLLAPYAGSRLTTNAIKRSGGLDAWQPSAAQLQDPEFRLWQWLKQADLKIPLFMGYGEQDRFVDGMQPMARRLPNAIHRTVMGGHDWPTWLALWTDFLETGCFAARG
jgi:pimeloyl-ACP methyl ester carboxylesterase